MMKLHTDWTQLIVRWQAMQSADDISVHQSIDWCESWKAAHNCDALVVEYGSSEGEMLLPLEVSNIGSLRIAKFLGTSFSNVNTGVISGFRDIDSEVFIQQLAKKLGERADLLMLDKMTPEWRGRQNLFKDLRSVESLNPSYQLELDGDFDVTLGRLNRHNRLKKFKSTRSKLNQAGGWDYEVVTDPAQASAVLNQYFTQKAERFRALGLPDVFRDEETQDFFHRLVQCSETISGHPLRLHTLRLRCRPEVPIAICGISTKGDYAITQFGSVDDDAVAGASPGEFLYHLVIQHFCALGYRLFDFGTGDQPYKRSWCNLSTQQYTYFLPLTKRGALAMHIYTAWLMIKRSLKSNPRVYKALQRFRTKW